MRPEVVVNEFIVKLRDLMTAVVANSDTYGTHYEEQELREFLLGVLNGDHEA